MVGAGARVALDDVQVLTVEIARAIEPRLIGEVDDVDDEVVDEVDDEVVDEVDDEVVDEVVDDVVEVVVEVVVVVVSTGTHV